VHQPARRQLPISPRIQAAVALDFNFLKRLLVVISDYPFSNSLIFRAVSSNEAAHLGLSNPIAAATDGLGLGSSLETAFVLLRLFYQLDRANQEPAAAAAAEEGVILLVSSLSSLSWNHVNGGFCASYRRFFYLLGKIHLGNSRAVSSVHQPWKYRSKTES